MRYFKTVLVFSFLVISIISISKYSSAKTLQKPNGIRIEYVLMDAGKTVWVKTIKCTQNHFPETLKIPDKIEGKDVVRLGPSYNIDPAYYDPNIFGIHINEDDLNLLPKSILEQLKTLKKVIFPNRLKELTWDSLYNFPTGKEVVVPGSLTKNFLKLKEAKCKKLTLSSKNSKYRVSKNTILSKDKKILYGHVGMEKNYKVPEGVQKIKAVAFRGKYKQIYIPKSVKKIEINPVYYDASVDRFKVSKKNKKYASQKRTIYFKKNGELLVASAKNKAIRLGSKIKIISDRSTSCGNIIEKIYFSKYFRKIKYGYTNLFTDEFNQKRYSFFYSKKPPILEKSESLPYGVLYVPKKSKKVYQELVNKGFNAKSTTVKVLKNKKTKNKKTKK